jgi:flagellar biosynthesis/type III secretory pathway protein FliH
MSASRMLRLEDFGSGAGPARSRAQSEALEQARAEAHAQGFAEGFAQAMETAEAEDQAAVVHLREAMQDIELALAAARAEAIVALRPVIAALAHAAAPRAAAAGFDAALIEAVEAQLKAAPGRKLTIVCAPERVAGMKARFGDRTKVVPDPAMTGAVARLEWPDGGAMFDVEACLAAAQETIGRFFGEAEDMRTSDVG